MRWAAVGGVAIGLTGVLGWPLTRSGYLLGHDLVFTPHQPLDAAGFGLGSAAPRAVPVDALVALAEKVLDGAVVGRIAVLGLLIAAGVGCAVLFRARGLPVRLAGCAAAIWNPFVVERLALGQWALLWCYAALPWLVLGLTASRRRTAWIGRAAALAVAAVTPTGALVAGAVAVTVAVALRRSRAELLGTVGLAVAVQLPWLVPALVSTASATSDPAGVAAFGARSEHGGRVLTLLGGGGIWDGDVVPSSRHGVLPFVWLAVLVLAAWAGARRLRSWLGSPTFAALTGVGLVGLLLAALPALPGGDDLLRMLVRDVPGAGLLRDSQKWLLPFVFLEVCLLAAAVDRLAERARDLPVRIALGVAAVAIPVLLLPDAPATLRPTLEPVDYPADWSQVADAAQGGAALVLPFAAYRSFGWAPGRVALDPAPRLLQIPSVVDDRLLVRGTLLAGEDARSAAAGRALAAADPAAAIARLGIAWVVVEHGTPGRLPDLSGLDEVYAGSDVSLYRVPDAAPPPQVSTGRVVAVVIGDSLAVLALLAALVAGLSSGRAARRTARR